MTIRPGDDGYYHPTTEAEVAELVLAAKRDKKSLRVRGAGHSVAAAIYTRGYDGDGKPPADAYQLMLDKLRAIGPLVKDGDDHAIVEVEAGCNLGKNPYDPTKTSTWANSLNYFLQQNGYALDDLGGITHQTLGGFLSTGSSGGSIKYSIDDDLVGITFVDGNGVVHSVSKDDADTKKRDMFFAAGVSMGLLGVITRVKLRVRKTYNLKGDQVTGAYNDLPVDLFGDGAPGKPDLETFLDTTDYTRLMWWPQTGFERMQVWRASRIDPTPDFKPIPYEELGDDPVLSSLAGSLFYTILGNLSDVAAVPKKLAPWFQHLEGAIAQDADVNACARPPTAFDKKIELEKVLEYLRKKLSAALAHHAAPENDARSSGLFQKIEKRIEGTFGDVVAWVITHLIELLLDGVLISPLAQWLANWLAPHLPALMPDILKIFVTDGTVTFQDTWMCGLPMDNQMDDQLWPTWFTELWIPIEKTKDVMNAMKAFYAGGGDPKVSFERTGAFSCELYAAKKSEFWMSASYGKDVFRVDVFWFALNAGDPAKVFYPQFWDLLAQFDLRPHWGKFLPEPASTYRDYYRKQLPRMDDFLKLRAELDPDGVFLTPYWRDHLGV